MSASPSTKRSRFGELQAPEIIQDSPLWLLPDKILTTILEFASTEFFNQNSFGLKLIMLTCKKFNKIVTTNQRLNRRFVFCFNADVLNKNSIAKNTSNRIALLVSQRKFQRVKVVNIRESSSFDHLCTLIQKFGHAVEEIKISGCKATEHTYCEIFKLIPYVKTISFCDNEIIDEAEELNSTILMHLKELKFRIKNAAQFESHRKLKIFSKTPQLSIIESDSISMNLMDTSNLIKLKELTISDWSTTKSIEFLSLTSQLKKFTGNWIDMKDFRKFFSSQNEIAEIEIQTKSSDYETMKVICEMKKLKKLKVDLRDEHIDKNIFNLSNFTVEEFVLIISRHSSSQLSWNTKRIKNFIKIFQKVKSLRIEDNTLDMIIHLNDTLNLDNLKDLKEIEIFFHELSESFLSVSLSKLTKVTFKFIAEYTTAEFEEFFERNPNIKSLKLIDTYDWPELLPICIKKMKNLKVLTMESEDECYPDPDKLPELLKILINWRTLKEFHWKNVRPFRNSSGDFIESFYKEKLPTKLFVTYNPHSHFDSDLNSDSSQEDFNLDSD